MRNARAAIAALTTMSLVGAMASLGGAAHAATTGVGTSQVTTTVANLQLGTNGALLGVRLLGDDARSTIDSKVVSTAEAFSRFTGLAVTSDTVAALKTLSSPTLESKQPGGEASVTKGSVNLSNPATDVHVPPTVLSGTIGLAHLSSEAAATQAKSALSATLTNATVGGGLASVTGVTSGLNTAAVSTQSDANRSVKVDQVVVLDLGSLLSGLGLPLTDLPVSVVQGLLTELQTTVTGLGAPAVVNSAIDDLQTQISDLEAAITAGATALPTGSTVTTIVDLINSTPLGPVVDPTTVTTISAGTVTQQLNDLLDATQDTLADVLAAVLATLDGAPLLQVDSVDVGVTTKAADTVADSLATVTAKIGAIKVGAANLGAVDLVDALTTINATVNGVNAQLKDTLKGIDPGLENLVTFSVFERATTEATRLTEANGYVTATDGITALKAVVTPPAALATIVSGIQAQTSIADEILSTAGGALPTGLSTSMPTLGTTTGNATPLSGGATFTLASLNSTSNFAPQVAGGGGGPGTENDRGLLSATGSNSTVPMTALALFLIALGLGFREWVRMPVPARVRSGGRG